MGKIFYGLCGGVVALYAAHRMGAFNTSSEVGRKVTSYGKKLDPYLEPVIKEGEKQVRNVAKNLSKVVKK